MRSARHPRRAAVGRTSIVPHARSPPRPPRSPPQPRGSGAVHDAASPGRRRVSRAPRRGARRTPRTSRAAATRPRPASGRCPGRCRAGAPRPCRRCRAAPRRRARARPRRRVNVASSIRPSTGPSVREHRPPAGAGQPQRGRRVAGRADLEVAAWRGRARGGRRSRSPRPSPGAAGSRWPRAGSCSGGRAPSRPPNAPESSSARVPASSALAGDVDDDARRGPTGRVGAVATTKSPANGVPPAEARADSTSQPVGQGAGCRPG